MRTNVFKHKTAVIICTILIFVSGALLNGCKMKKTDKTCDDEKIHIITTIFASYDFAKQVVQESGNVEMLLSPGEESHSYDPTPKDIIKIQNCDLFIYNGGESEEWVEHILNDIPETVKVIKMMDCNFKKIEEEDEDEFDEHVWASPVNAAIITEKIAETLSGINPEKAEIYKKNSMEYCKQIKELDDNIRNIVEKSKRKMIVFGDRFPMRYFVNEYGLDYCAAFPGCSADVEASPSVLASLINTVKENNIPVVIKMEFGNGRIAEAISAETGATVKTFYVGHNVSKDDFNNKTGYLELMKRNAEVLKEALY